MRPASVRRAALDLVWNEDALARYVIQAQLRLTDIVANYEEIGTPVGVRPRHPHFINNLQCELVRVYS